MDNNHQRLIKVLNNVYSLAKLDYKLNGKTFTFKDLNTLITAVRRLKQMGFGTLPGRTAYVNDKYERVIIEVSKPKLKMLVDYISDDELEEAGRILDEMAKTQTP